MESLTIPYVISRSVVDAALKAGPPGVDALLRPHVAQIRAAWKRGTRVESVLLACGSLRRALPESLPPTESGLRLTLVEADASLASAVSSADADRAFDLAEQAQSDLGRLDPLPVDHVDLLSEAMLVAGVALKAIGMFDESISYMRLQIADRGLDPVASISLRRQEVMMFQDRVAHVRLLDDIGSYRDARPLEYFRTLKRLLEYLLSHGFNRAAQTLAPETGRAFDRSQRELSALGQVSFLKNVAQVTAINGETYRALRLLHVVERMALTAGFAGQVRQARSLMGALDGAQPLSLPTFALPRG